jgi:competence protein ComEA
MPTPAERNALLFLAAVTVLGGGVRAARAVGDREAPPPAAERALAAQRDAVARETAAREATAKGKGKGRGRQPPAGPTRARGARPAPSAGPPLGPPARATTVDVDRATAEQLDALPRVGPALAARIVADRDSLGPFGSLAGLGRVRGVGPAMLERLRAHVTFSGTPRPTSAAAAPRRRSARPP